MPCPFVFHDPYRRAWCPALGERVTPLLFDVVKRALWQNSFKRAGDCFGGVAWNAAQYRLPLIVEAARAHAATYPEGAGLAVIHGKGHGNVEVFPFPVMTPAEYAERILAESRAGTAWEWTCAMSPKGYRAGWDRLTFGDELRKSLPTEIVPDIRIDRLTVRRVHRIDEVPRWKRTPPKEQQQELF